MLNMVTFPRTLITILCYTAITSNNTVMFPKRVYGGYTSYNYIFKRYDK